MTISSSEERFSTVIVTSFPLWIAGMFETCLDSHISSLTPIPIESPSNVAAKNVHSSSTMLFDSTVVHLIPSYTENFAIFSGWILLLIERENDFSLLITVNSGDP